MDHRVTGRAPSPVPMPELRLSCTQEPPPLPRQGLSRLSPSSLWRSIDAAQTQERGISLLFIAGDTLHTQLVSMVLSTSQFSMYSQSDADESTVAPSLELPDIVLLDWDTEGVDGFAVLQELRACAETEQVPVIVMTNRAFSPHWQRELAALGVKWVLEKPIVALGLPRLIERTIAAAQKRVEQNCQFQPSALLVECGQTASGANFKSI